MRVFARRVLGKAAAGRPELVPELKSTATYLFIQGLSRAGSLLALLILFARLTPVDFGIIAVSEIANGFLACILGLSLDQAVTRSYYEKNQEIRREWVGTIWLSSWVSAVGIGGGLCLVSPWWGPLVFPQVRVWPFVPLSILYAVVSSFAVVPLATLRIRQEPRRYAFISLARMVIMTTAILLPVLLTDSGAKGYLLGSVGGGILFSIVCVVLMGKIARPVWRFHYLREALSYSLPLIPASVISSASGVIDKIVLQRVATLETAGLYSVCYRLSTAVTYVHEAVKMSSAPFIFRNLSENQHDSMSKIGDMIKFYLAPVFLAGITICLFSPDLAAITGRAAYAPLGYALPLFVLSRLCSSLNLYFAPGAWVAKRTAQLLVPALAQAAVVTVGCLALTPVAGLLGPIGARLAGAVVYLSINVLITRRICAEWRAPWKTAWLNIAVAGFCAGVGCARYFGHSRWWLAGAVIVECLALLVIGRHLLERPPSRRPMESLVSGDVKGAMLEAESCGEAL